MFLSQNCVKFIRKFIYVQFCIKVVVLNRSYSTNTQPIWKRWYPTGFLIDIIDNIITFSSYYVIRTSANGSVVNWSHDFRTPEILRFHLIPPFQVSSYTPFHFSFTVSLMIEFYLFRLFSLKYVMIPKKYVSIKLYLLLIWANRKI